YCKFSIKGIIPKQYIIPVIVYGAYMISTSLYTTFNTFYLGLTCGNEQVAYFEHATKLNKIIMNVFTAFTMVMVPHIVELLKEGRNSELQGIANKTFNLLTITAMPIIFFCLFCAPQIIEIISGREYLGAVIPFRIVIFMILIIGFEQIIIQQFLLASKNNKAILIISSTGAIVGLTLNFILTPNLLAIGSSISWATSELCTLVIGAYFVKKIQNVTINYIEIFKNIIISFIYIIPLYGISQITNGLLTSTILSATSVIILFILINVFFHKNELLTKQLKLKWR
nr:polysaccharide biosynthesis C-terminal domain-containing protein [Bacteroidaceae bacterium]